MDVIRLDPVTFQPDILVEGYSSMIWTERFSENGEFELKTSKIQEARNELPVASLISLVDSDEVMFVEDHSLTRTDGVSELVVTGRTFETFLENRAMYGIKYGETWPTLQPYTNSQMACLLVWNYLVNASGEDVTRPNQTIDNLLSVANIVVTDESPIVDSSVVQSLAEGEVYERLRTLLKASDLGVRSIRPAITLGKVITFDTTRTATRGTVKESLKTVRTELSIDFYRGVDRRYGQPLNMPVVFRYDAGHIIDPNNLTSIKDYKNIVIASTSDGFAAASINNAYAAAAGLNRRILYFDGGKRETTEPSASFIANVKHKGLGELDKHAKVHLFDGEVAPDIPYIYGRDYGLGDQITVIGYNGFLEDLVVSEYIRTHTAEGDRGYPGLTEPLPPDDTRRFVEHIDA